jgi:SpoVK/Ycf46/Vps4 family AAA+-type ATPase
VTSGNAGPGRRSGLWVVIRRLPLPLKLLGVLALMAGAALLAAVPAPVADLLFLLVLCYTPVALWRAHRSILASLSVAATGAAVILVEAAKTQPLTIITLPLVLLPFVMVAAAHARALSSARVPCRTVAWTLVWSLPSALLLWALLPADRLLAVGAAWLLAAVVVAWRLVSILQATRIHARLGSRGVLGAAVQTRGGTGARDGRPSLDGVRPGEPAGVRAADGARASSPVRDISPEDLPEITVEQAMAELDAMIGLEPVKEQIRQLTASVEAARRRARAGYTADKPMHHFVFLGPPGTGKTSVARVLARIYYAAGLLDSPQVVEAQRADLVGEYLGATAIKTNELVDSALGGILFIDEAYSLVNNGEGQTDRFGNEAVQALLKRAEDDRDDLVVVLAGYERQMEEFLSSNPGLNSRFGIRIKFPGYSGGELTALALAALAQRGEALTPEAHEALVRMMQEVDRRRLGDELGNGRFIRSLLEKAGQARDVRVMAALAEPTAADLLTLDADDLERSYSELTARFRGYSEPPSVDSALAELDLLIGLEPVKRQVHEIAAQLRVARVRDRQGLSSAPPARHFVFTGPPGTGKTTVARILGRIFAALGLLVRSEVIEAHRADLIGEHLGSTAIKTGKLIDSALGGVLFIDEAYSLYNPGYTGGDAYGAEAVATLLKRAEDDRERLVVVLAGYPRDMDRFLRSNPGLSSRFNIRIDFPSFQPAELARIALMLAEQAGDSFAPGALPVLGDIFGSACSRGQIDELGNGRFARSLFERACAARDMRIADLGDAASPLDLTTITAADLTAAVADLTGGGRPAMGG